MIIGIGIALVREQGASTNSGVVRPGVGKKGLIADSRIAVSACVAKERLEAGGGVKSSGIGSEGLIANSSILGARADDSGATNVSTP
jgi:hypothetical protein